MHSYLGQSCQNDLPPRPFSEDSCVVRERERKKAFGTETGNKIKKEKKRKETKRKKELSVGWCFGAKSTTKDHIRADERQKKVENCNLSMFTSVWDIIMWKVSSCILRWRDDVYQVSVHWSDLIGYSRVFAVQMGGATIAIGIAMAVSSNCPQARFEGF